MKLLSSRDLFAYGLFALPLAMIALPIYVYLPQFYSERVGLPLSMIGVALLGTRVAAAFIDPLLGWFIERGAARFAHYVLVALPILLIGFIALFNPPPLRDAAALTWFVGTLMLVYVGFSLATIAHQSWGAALTQVLRERARVSGWRETCALAGVMLAAGTSAASGYVGLCIAFVIALVLGSLLLLALAPRPPMSSASMARPFFDWRQLALPFSQRRFRALFAILIVNGIASAIPATLFLFFVTDRLQLGSMAGQYLMLYFGCAAVSIPLWVKLATRLGESRAWLAAMLLSAAVFVWAFWIGAGGGAAFAAICVFSGLTLGADLVLPAALLTGVISTAGHSGQREAAYFGLWNWGVQISLALAAGLSLPLLESLGYTPGSTHSTDALAAVYALCPCVMKLTAAAMLWRAPLRDC